MLAISAYSLRLRLQNSTFRVNRRNAAPEAGARGQTAFGFSLDLFSRDSDPNYKCNCNNEVLFGSLHHKSHASDRRVRRRVLADDSAGTRDKRVEDTLEECIGLFSSI